MERLRAVLLALAIGAAGGVIASSAGFPAPWLTGPAFFVTVGAMAGLRLSIPNRLRNTVFTVIGMTIGSGVTPEMVATAAQWPLSIVILVAAMVVIMTLGTVLLERGFGYDRTTALLGAAPGHLSYVLSLSTAIRADIPAISIIQSTRVLVLTLAVPFLAAAIAEGGLEQALPDGEAMTAMVLVATTLVAIGLALVFQRLNVPAAFLLGGMLASSAGHLTGVGPGLVPAWLTIPAFVVMGTLIGTRFSGVSLALIRHAAAAALAFTALAGIVAVMAGLLATGLLGLPLVQTLVAYAPGGLEAMAAMALLLGVNPAFVAAHHIARLLFLTLLIPLATHRAARPTARDVRR